MTAIAIIGEAYGADEEAIGKPFVGASGQELTRMLTEAGINRADCFISNVFNFRPKDNGLETLCCQKKDLPKGYHWPALSNGLYLREEYLGEIDRLKKEMESVRPNIIVALGNTATWALMQQTAISKIRGSIAQSNLVEGCKCLPTYHPAAILRDWSLRHVTVLDLMKARVESAFHEIRIPVRRISVPENLEDIDFYINNFILPAKELSFDIETAAGQITCIGFAPGISDCLVIPILDYSKPDKNYWPTVQIEVEVWKRIRYILGLRLPKFGQNLMYDCQYLWQVYGIPVMNVADDTMLLHHSLLPESEKSLGFLGSVYTNSPSWKFMRKQAKHADSKREE